MSNDEQLTRVASLSSPLSKAYPADTSGTVHSQENTICFKRQHGPQLTRVDPQSRFNRSFSDCRVNAFLKANTCGLKFSNLVQ